jgi:hypothetical protein
VDEELTEADEWLPELRIVVVVLLAAVVVMLVAGMIAALGLHVTGSTRSPGLPSLRVSSGPAPWRQRLAAFSVGVGTVEGILLVGAALLVRWQAWRGDETTRTPVAVSVRGVVVALGAAAEFVNGMWDPSPGLGFSTRIQFSASFAVAAVLAGLAARLMSDLFKRVAGDEGP